MVTDREMNRLCFSSRLATEPRFRSCYQKLETILSEHNVKHTLLEGTRDIWCRDYMPIQVSNRCLVQFRYEPSYLNGFEHLHTEPNALNMPVGFNVINSSINLDGGNVVRWHDRVIISDRIFTENPNTDRTALISTIERLLGAEVLICPQIKSDMTGHADGLVRWYDKDTLIGSALDFEFAYWKKGMQAFLKQHRLKYIDVPSFEYQGPGKSISALGCYVNFLEIQNLILLPVFEVEGNRDQEVIDLFTAAYPERKIIPVNINPIASLGGVVNCISWGLKKEP